jgi:hypothetical protein
LLVRNTAVAIGAAFVATVLLYVFFRVLVPSF